MSHYLKFEDIRTIQIEPTSRCNLLCPQCARTFKGRVNPELPLTELTREDYERIFSTELTSRLKTVLFNGNYGDPVIAKEFDFAVELLLSQKVQELRVFTNGSLRDHAWWQDLGRRLAPTDSCVIFAIDGLHDTNSTYRVNSSFDKIVENAQAYIASGGKARWDFIVFSHNEHQVDEARIFAKKLGFIQFNVKRTARFINASNYRNHSSQSKVQITGRDGLIRGELRAPSSTKENDFDRVIEKYGSWKRYVDQTKINCKYQNDLSGLFIDFAARVWPCCWVGAPIHFADDENPQKVQILELLSKYDKHFNSIRHHTLEEILAHPWFAGDLVSSWGRPMAAENGKLMTCGRTCGQEYEFTSGPGGKNSRITQLSR